MSETLQAIQKTYEEAQKIANLQPWTYLEESEVFAIEHPESHVLYFVQVIGKTQPLLGVQISKGYEAYLRLQDWLKMGDAAIKANKLALYALHFNLEPLTEIDQVRLKVAGFTEPTPHGWPHFKDFTPEYLPWHLSDEDFYVLQILLPQTRLLLQLAESDPSLLASAEGCLIRRLENGLWHNEVQNNMPEEREKLSYLRPEEPQPLMALPQNSGAVFEAVMELSNVPFQTKPDERPFYPWIFLLIDAADGQLLDYRLTARQEHFASVSEGIVEALRKTGYRPSEILTEDTFTQVLISGVCQELGFSVRKATLEYGNRLVGLIQKKLANA
jgi:hypothetical protein